MKMSTIKKIFAGLFAAGVLFMSPQMTFAERQEVPEDIYKWVDSTNRGNYFFNRQQIGYAVSEDGFIDLNTLVVPMLITYDEIQIQDVIKKRQWNMKSTKGYDKLVGRADYVVFKLTEGTVQVTERVDLDEKWGTLDTDTSGQPINLSDLSPNSVRRKIFREILKYAKDHNEEMINRSWGKLTPEDEHLSEDNMPLMKLEFP
ncbi:MAG: hypothetical protein IJ797_10275 [Selenomonadaceae bacterium]|nr:hypothetical protein [Selenomonadaceae bacterium]